MRKENFVTSHLENRKKSQSSSDSHRTATRKRILSRRRLPAHTKSAWALVVFTKREGCCSPDEFVVYYWCPRSFKSKKVKKPIGKKIKIPKN